MAKAAHTLVSVLFGGSAVGLWFLITAASSVFARHLKNEQSLNELTLFCLHFRNYLLLIPLGAAVWTAFVYRRPSVSMESAFLYFLSAAIVTVGLFLLAGITAISTQVSAY